MFFSLNDFWEDSKINTDLPFFELAEEIVKKICLIPKPEIQRKLFLFSILTPSRFATSLPRFLAYGRSGTGKTTLTKAAIAIRGLNHKNIKSGGTSGAAFRNDLENLKYSKAKKIISDKENEDGKALSDIEKDQIKALHEEDCFLVQDDINGILISRDVILLSILKSGIDRSTAEISIAEPGTGKNLNFNTFGSYFFSSCEQIWCHEDLYELKRRLMIFQFKKYDLFSETEKALNEKIENLIDIEDYDFSYFREYDRFWDNQKNKTMYKTMYMDRKLRTEVKNLPIPSNFSRLYFSLIITGLVFLKDKNLVFDLFVNYYNEIFSLLMSNRNAIEIWIENYLENQENLIRESQAITHYSTVIIPSNVFFDALKKAEREGQFLEYINKKYILRIMQNNDYALKKSETNKNQMVWIKHL